MRLGFLRTAIVNTPLWPLLRPRRIHLYGVGAPKTGTQSIATMFAASYRAAHEAHIGNTVSLIQTLKSKRITRKQAADLLKQRDRKRRLECESFSLLMHVSGLLAETFPRARFILTIRDPYSWLDSVINHHINHGRDSAPRAWRRADGINFGPLPASYPPEEEILRNHKVWAVSTYLRYYAYHNKRVLDTIPADRLFILATGSISQGIDELAEFAGIPPESISERHTNKAPRRHSILDRVDRDYLDSRIKTHLEDVLASVRGHRNAAL